MGRPARRPGLGRHGLAWAAGAPVRDGRSRGVVWSFTQTRPAGGLFGETAAPATASAVSAPRSAPRQTRGRRRPRAAGLARPAARSRREPVGAGRARRDPQAPVRRGAAAGARQPIRARPTVAKAAPRPGRLKARSRGGWTPAAASVKHTHSRSIVKRPCVGSRHVAAVRSACRHQREIGPPGRAAPLMPPERALPVPPPLLRCAARPTVPIFGQRLFSTAERHRCRWPWARGGRCSEVKEETTAGRPSSGDMSGSGHPATAARALDRTRLSWTYVRRTSATGRSRPLIPSRSIASRDQAASWRDVAANRLSSGPCSSWRNRTG